MIQSVVECKVKYNYLTTVCRYNFEVLLLYLSIIGLCYFIPIPLQSRGK